MRKGTLKLGFSTGNWGMPLVYLNVCISVRTYAHICVDNIYIYISYIYTVYHMLYRFAPWFLLDILEPSRTNKQTQVLERAP